MSKIVNPFPTVSRLAEFCDLHWQGYQRGGEQTAKAEEELRKALTDAGIQGRMLDVDCALVLFGSFARREMAESSDYDWALLVDGVANVRHAKLVREIADALANAKLVPPGSTGTFGGTFYSHDLVHCIGGGADSNANLTRRMLMLLESRCFNTSCTDEPTIIWHNVVSNILERYFEEDVHFSVKGKRRVPRFLLNDLTRYWRTICVDYAAKYREQDGRKWALRNAKLRFSRKLLYATGLAFCLSCQLDPPNSVHMDLFGDETPGPYIERALKFAQTPPLEYLAAFIESFVTDEVRRRRIAKDVFGSYDEWLLLLGDNNVRDSLAELGHANAEVNEHFQKIRRAGSRFASGLRELFFNRDQDPDPIANLSLDYVGF